MCTFQTVGRSSLELDVVERLRCRQCIAVVMLEGGEENIVLQGEGFTAF